ncbi:hypothetical protein BGX30_014630 [Mortierella sp. GBA39]|nr:hypothetical protein BGX30_014630 [Mortierella sp. GBA39]
MSSQSQDGNITHYTHSTHSPAQPRSSTKRDSLQQRFSFDSKFTRIASSTSGSCSSTEWDSDMDRTAMRGLDSSSSDEDLDDDDDDVTSEEQSESDSDRRRISSQHLLASVKRRKVSVDEDYERLQPLQLPDEVETRPTNMVSSNKQRQSRPISSSATLPFLSNNHRRHQSLATATTTSSTRPSSWPAKKRRSFIAEPESTSTFSFSDPLSNEPSSSATLSSSSPLSATGLDTSSLSLLSETSMLVSEGTISSLGSDNVSLRVLLEPSSSSPSLLSSSPLPSSNSCFSLTPSAGSPFPSADRAQFNAQELFESASPPTSSFSSSSSPSSSSSSSSLPSLLSPTTTTATATTSPATRSRYQRYHQQQQSLLGACRKRTFEDAIELTRPLGNDPSVEHAGWLGSIKRRKIHHFPTRWTSSLSPSPYIKLLAMRDFWDVMMTRLDLSWLNLWTASGSKSETLRGFGGGVSDMEDDEDGGPGRIRSPLESEAEADEMDTEQVNAIRSSDSEDNTGDATQEHQSRAIFEQPQLTRISSLKKSDDKDGILAETIGSPWSMCVMSRRKKRTVVQHPSAALFLRGLWEEEEHGRRQKQMIPEGVHKPLRSKVLNRKPLVRTAAAASTKALSSSGKSQSLTIGSGSSSTLKETLPSAALSSSTSESSTSSSSTGSTYDESDSIDKENSKEESDSQGASSSNAGDQDMVLRKKYGPTAALRSNAVSDGYDLNEYKPWKDATITPHRGCIQTLRQMRCTMLEPWPVEGSRAKDECSRILHVMREQLNVVINLQIHLRSMIKTAPQQMSFLLSIRHPGQISIELLSALYGPQFMQTNAFRSIEQLLWGKNHSWKAGESSPSLSSSSLQHHRPPSQLTRNASSPSSSSSSSYSQQHQYQQRQQHAEHPYHHHHSDHRDVDDGHDSMFDGADDVHHYQTHHYQDHGDHAEDYEPHRRHQYPQHHDYDHGFEHEHDQSVYHEHSEHSYYDQHHHHNHQQQQHHSTSQDRHHYDSEQSSSLRYTRTLMEDVSECEFEDEFDEPPYLDPLLEIERINAATHSTTTGYSAVEKRTERLQRKNAVTMSMDGGYESGGDVSEGEIEALEISSSSTSTSTSSSSSSLAARSFQR